MKKLLIVGAGGFSMEVAWVAEENNALAPNDPPWEILGYADDNEKKIGTMIFDYQVLGRPEDLAARLAGQEVWYHTALGNNAARRKMAERLERFGWQAATLIHPSVIRARGVEIGPGTYVGALSVLCPASKIGRQVLINQRVAVGHGVELGDFSQLCPGAQVNGDCRIGAGALIGSNASIHQGKSVGAEAVVGANSLVVRSVAPATSVMGIPARNFFATSTS